MATTVLPTFDLATISPAQAKFLTQAYAAIFTDGLEVFQGRNSLGDTITINQYGLSSLLTRLTVENKLELETVLERLRELAAVATVENTTTSLDQAALNSLVAANEEHLNELKKDRQQAIQDVQNRLERITRLTRGNPLVSPSQPAAQLSDNPEITAAIQKVNTSPPDTVEYSSSLSQLEAAVARHLPPETAPNVSVIAADLVRRSAVPQKTTVPTQPISPETITTQVATNSFQQTINRLPLTTQQKSEINALLQSHDTLSHVVTQIHHPDNLVPGQTLTEIQTSQLRDQVYTLLGQDLGNKLSPLAISAITDTVIGQALPVAKITTELQLAQKSESALLASETLPVFSPDITKIQEQIEWLFRVIPPDEADLVISNAIKSLRLPENKQDLINLQDLSLQIRQGLSPDTIRALQSGLTAEGLSDAIQKQLLPPNYAAIRNKVRNAQEGTFAAGAAPAQPSSQKLSPIKSLDLQNGQPRLNLATTGPQPSSLWLAFKARVGQQEVSPRQIISVPSSPTQSPFALFSPSSLLQTRERLENAQRLLQTPPGRFLLRLQHSPLGRFTTFLRQHTLDRVSSWIARQTATIALKNTFGLALKQVALTAAKVTLAKTVAKEALKKLVVKAGVSLLARLGINLLAAPETGGLTLVVALLDLAWTTIKTVLNPQNLKKIFNWLADRPWVLAAMFAAPLFLGAPGFILAGTAALVLLGIGITGGTAALASMGGTLAAGILGFLGIILAPIIIPIIVAASIFLAMWLFYTLFYLLFILPQGFMTNQTARQISLISTQSPVYLSLSKSASPRTLTNDQITQISTLPQTITYTISLVLDQGTSLSNIKPVENVTLVSIDNNGQITHKDLQAPNNLQKSIPASIPNGSLISVSYTLTLDNQFLLQNSLKPQDLTDSLISNTITLTFDAKNSSETLTGLTRSAQAVVIIGNPKVTSPSGWPIWDNSPQQLDCVTQGPNAPFSHRGIQAIDISSPTGSPVHATHPGTISWWWDPADGFSIIITSPDKLYSTIYAHLDNRAPVGPVNFGDIVGYTTTNMRNGFMTGPHLHYQLKGSPINGPSVNAYLDPPAPVPSAIISGCTYQGKDFHVTHP